MSETHYQDMIRRETEAFVKASRIQTEALDPAHPFRLWLDQIQDLLVERPLPSERLSEVVCSLFTHFGEMTPLFPRDVLYLLGGECLHYMPDEEISAYQELDELRFSAEYQGKSFNWEQAKETLKKLQ
jgi:hypothetical protein